MKKVLRKRYIRNTLMITMIIVLAACSCFTYGYATEQARSNAIDSIESQFGETPSGQTPDFDNSQNGEMPSADGRQTGDNQSPPEMPEGETQSNPDGNAQPEMPSGNEQSGSTESANVPSRSENGPSKGKPSGSNDNQQSDGESAEEDTARSANGPSKGGNQQMPSGDNQQMTPPDFNGQMPRMGGSAAAQIATKYIVLLAAENLLIAAITVYLLLSRFNKRGFKKTLKNTKNAIIFALAVILLTASFTFAQFAASTRTEIPFDGRPEMSQNRQMSGEEESTSEQPDANTNQASIGINI